MIKNPSLSKSFNCLLTIPNILFALDAAVEFYLYPTVGTVLIYSIKPELTE